MGPVHYAKTILYKYFRAAGFYQLFGVFLVVFLLARIKPHILQKQDLAGA
jgi:hypothetical protein